MVEEEIYTHYSVPSSHTSINVGWSPPTGSPGVTSNITPDPPSLNLMDLFKAYDENFFGGQLNDQLIKLNQQCYVGWNKLETRIGNYSFSKSKGIHTISLSKILLNSNTIFPITIGGHLCKNLEDAIKRALEHELIHLYLTLMGHLDSFLHTETYMKAVNHYFSHTSCGHSAVAPLNRDSTFNSFSQLNLS